VQRCWLQNSAGGEQEEIWGMQKQALRYFGFGTESPESLYCLLVFPVARVVFLTALIEAES
jgi:hypothetical protein